jgi:hypothetical protein
MKGTELSYKTRFIDLVKAWKREFKDRAGGKMLTNEVLAEVLGIKREHFQKILQPGHTIDQHKYETLKARYLLWYYATNNGASPQEAISVENYPTSSFLGLISTKKSGSVKEPDPNLLIQLKKQAEDLIASLHKLSTSQEVSDEENVNQGAAYSGFEQDKNQKAGKR